jgi:hypothetical protein
MASQVLLASRQRRAMMASAPGTVQVRAGGVALEVAQGRVQLGLLDPFEGIDAGGAADALDVAVVEVVQAGSGRQSEDAK